MVKKDIGPTNETEINLTHLRVADRVICEVCQQEFQQKRWWQVVCSPKCKAAKKRQDWELFKQLRYKAVKEAQKKTS